ncbi:MAG TPA: DUF2905 domain-containing protein [Chitinophagaceae bacterium]|jgi:H+/Cl- antiporter ClcA|nr:DUF2905 domain-containing protein [Chitinophagaceae bacterium]
MPQLGKYIIFFGIALVVIGLIVYFLGGRLNWFGRLPGDIRVERENVRFYFPVVTMILVSLVLSLVLYLVRRFF